ncbi:hypothetical protein NGA_2107100, partial [Nannochloropsis gaditana CCMP526]
SEPAWGYIYYEPDFHIAPLRVPYCYHLIDSNCIQRKTFRPGRIID